MTKQIEILGKTFNSEEEARQFYNEDLRKRLPELKQIEGFPIGEDEDILALSNPPFYTACPNPYINEFIEKYGKPYNEETDDYHREPFVGYVSEGKGEAIYNAHTYHTKVHPKAIENYIEHFTNEGDIVLDGFAGTGMTGVASQAQNRHVILNDLFPIASFITYCLNSKIDVADFFTVANNILAKAENEIGWVYETKSKNRINYIINVSLATMAIASWSQRKFSGKVNVPSRRLRHLPFA